VVRQSFSAPYHIGNSYLDSGVMQVRIVNTTAGILAGDSLEVDVEAGEGASLCLLTPAATRAYRMGAGSATCRQRFRVASGAWLEHLPEPLHPHRDSHYTQHTRLELAAGAAAFWVDQLAPGRAGMGEMWCWRRLNMLLEVELDGMLVLREQLDSSGEEMGRLAAFHGMPEAWFANAVVAGPALPPGDSPVWSNVRALHRDGCLCGATAIHPKVWIVRIVAPGGLLLRDRVSELRSVLAESLAGLRTDLRRI
jgi:urease accessory protein